MIKHYAKNTRFHIIRNLRALYVCFCIFCYVLFCTAQKEHQFINGLKGKVKSVKAVTKRVELKKDSANRETFGKIDDNGTQYAKFDRKGRFTEWGSYSTKWVKDGERLVEEHFCRYYADGTMRQDSCYLPEEKIYYNYLFTYNKTKTRLQKWCYTNNAAMEGKFLCSESFFMKGLRYKEIDYVNEVTILFNEREDFLQSTDFGESKPDQVSVYDSLGREIVSKYWTEGDSLPETETYTYDSAGRVVLYISCGNDYKRNYKEITEYSKNGNLVSNITYSLKDSLIEKTLYTHSEAINEQKTYDHNGVLISMLTCKYNTRGNLIEEEGTDNIIGDYRHTSIATYEYDSSNNWTKKSWRDGYGYIYITTREITYH